MENLFSLPSLLPTSPHPLSAAGLTTAGHRPRKRGWAGASLWLLEATGPGTAECRGGEKSRLQPADFLKKLKRTFLLILLRILRNTYSVDKQQSPTTYHREHIQYLVTTIMERIWKRIYVQMYAYIYTNIYTHTHLLCFSVAQSCWTLCDPMNCSTPGLPVPHHLLKFAQVHVLALVMPYSHLILWRLLLLSSIFPSIRDFSNEFAVCIDDEKYWSFSFSISPSNEYSGLISLKVVWFDHLAVQGTFRILLQYHILKASTHTYMYIKKLNQLYTRK